MVIETMNIHRALAEKKLIDDKIDKIINNTEFVSYHVVGNEKVHGIPTEQFISEAKSKLDATRDMFARRDALNRGIQISNATTRVTIMGKQYTVAEAIWMHQYGMKMIDDLKYIISEQYQQAVAKVDKYNQLIESQADTFVQNIYNNDSKSDSDMIAKTRKDYIEARKMELVDPIHATNVIEKLTDYIQSFLAEVNTTLSTSNATTEITIKY